MRDKHSKSVNRWLAAALAVSALVIGGLGAATWKLGNEVADLRNDPLHRSDRLADLVQEQQDQSQMLQDSFMDPRMDPRMDPLLDPRMNPFADPFGVDPFAQLQAMRQQMDQLFQSGPGGFGSLFNGSSLNGFGPGISLSDKGDHYEVVIPVAENAELELQTEIDNNVLSISGKVLQQDEQNNGNMLSSRMSTSQFSRSIALPGEVDETGLATQHLADQVIITVPKEAG